MNSIVSVSQVSEYIKSLLEGDGLLSGITIRGELSNFKAHTTGHCYFTLKDEGAVINGVMFRGDASKLRFRPESGMKVIVSGRVSSFPKNGQYQVYVAQMQPDGVGDLAAAYEMLKDKLHKEGLFDKSHKKPLPQYPKCVALITSPTGAAVHDMIRVISTRYKACDILVCPVLVQGISAPGSISGMIDYVNLHKLADVIITGRGGGSMEDLWCFNDEGVARAIYASEIPVISAVGHEPDITIADYVADVRGATPSNAGEIVVPDGSELGMRISEWKSKMYAFEMKKLGYYKDKLEAIKKNRMLTSPYAYVNQRGMVVNMHEQRLVAAMEKIIQLKQNQYIKVTSTLDAISPLKVIARGYSLVQVGDNIIKSKNQVKLGDTLVTRLADGRIYSKVLKMEGNDGE